MRSKSLTLPSEPRAAAPTIDILSCEVGRVALPRVEKFARAAGAVGLGGGEGAVRCWLSSGRLVRVCRAQGSSRRWRDCRMYGPWALDGARVLEELTGYGPKGLVWLSALQ